MKFISLSVFFGFLMDCVLGDPERLWHPVMGIGSMISFWKNHLKKWFSNDAKGQLVAGIFLWILVVIPSWLIPYGLLSIAQFIHPLLRFILETIFCWQIFAAKSLKIAALRVYNALKMKDVLLARKYVSWIVGRDTAHLNEEQIVKATVETVAENTSDGVIAPLCFMLIGGAPLGFAYKAVNTLDSMVGYKNDEFLYFGRFSAKMDDIWNFVPARISGLLFVLCAAPAGLNMQNAWKCFKRDRQKHASPNSAQTEAACAGALEIQLAGDAYYFGKLYQKPTLGDRIKEIQLEDIVRANRLMYDSSVVAVILLCGIRLLFDNLFLFS